METQSDLFNTRVIGLPGKREEKSVFALNSPEVYGGRDGKKSEVFFWGFKIRTPYFGVNNP